MPPVEQQPPRNQSASNVLAHASFELSQIADHKKYLNKSMIQWSQSSLLSQDESTNRITPSKRASTVNKFLCKWDNCNEMFDTRGQLMNHVRVLHTEPLEGTLFEPQLTTTIKIALPEVVMDFDLILDQTNESLTQEPVIFDVQANLIIDPNHKCCKGKNSKKVKRHDRFNEFKKLNLTTQAQHSTSRIPKREFKESSFHFDGNEVIPTPKRIKMMSITTNEQILPKAASTPIQSKIDETDLDKHLTDISKSVLRTPVELQSTRSTRLTRSSVKLRTSNTGSELVESKVVLKDPPEQPNRKPNDSTTSNVSHSKMNKLYKCKDCNKPYMFEKHLLNHCQKIHQHQQPNKLPTQSSSSSSTTSPTTKPMSTKSKQAKSEQERLFVCPHVGCTSSFTIRDIYKHVQSHSKSSLHK